jgi:subtilase family serine protease
MHIIYFTIIHWLAIAFFIILFIALALLSAQAKKTSIILSGIFASFLVTTFGATLVVIILEKYTKKGMMINVKERRILFNETLFIKGYIQNVGRFPLNYCKVTIKLINNDRKQFGKGTFFKSGGLSIFGDKEKKLAKPNTVFKEKYFTFTPPLKPNYRQPFSIEVPYPGYFRGTMIIKKIYCH